MIQFTKKELGLVLVLVVLLLFLTIRYLGPIVGDPASEKVFNATDSVWLELAVAMENEDIEFLLDHAMDSITCVDCIPENSAWEEATYPAEYLFLNHLSELMHLEALSTSNFSSYQDSSMIRVGYNLSHPMAEEGGYTMVFTLHQVGKKYLLADRFFVP